MTLEEIILLRIPPAVLERVVFDQGVLDEERRARLFKASGLSPQEIALQMVEAYGADKPRLALGLYEQVSQTDWDTALLLFQHFKSRPDMYYYNHQASLVSRIPTLPLLGLSTFLEEVKGRVCLIVSRRGDAGSIIRGTGFLVGPDLILTCKHVLKSFPENEDVTANGNRIEIFFDFHHGAPVEQVEQDIPLTRKVGLHKNWHVASGSDVNPDGLLGELEPDIAQRVSQSLDFALVRLDQKVGLQPVETAGGRRRLWVKFPPDTVPQGLRRDDWIIIPQHPNGLPQRIDLGRFWECDQTNTRIRYSTNTAHGTSGAPCFNHRYELVGIHNAYVGPPVKPLANQAIRLDHIAAAVRAHLTEGDTPSPYAKRWSTSRPNEAPRAILGRDLLLDWLAASPKASTLAGRVYVAQTSHEDAGCTFSIDILHAQIRDTRTPRAIYGSAGQQLPSTAEDFLISLIRELGIDLQRMVAEATAQPMPPRPSESAPGAPSALLTGEVDKLERWRSEELPKWLGDVIAADVEKKVDARVAARQAVDVLKQQGIDVPQDLQDKADAPNEIWVHPNAWDVAYVVIDDLRAPSYEGPGTRTELTGDVQSLLAALVKGRPEASMHPGLKRLRWMFLGRLPDFIAVGDADANGATLEALNPTAAGQNEILGVFTRMADTHMTLGLGFNVARASVGLIAQLANNEPGNRRMAVLQKAVNEWTENLLKELGS